MKKLNDTSRYVKAKMKGYYGGVALIALMCVSSTSEAMDPEDEAKRTPPAVNCHDSFNRSSKLVKDSFNTHYISYVHNTNNDKLCKYYPNRNGYPSSSTDKDKKNIVSKLEKAKDTRRLANLAPATSGRKVFERPKLHVIKTCTLEDRTQRRVLFIPGDDNACGFYSLLWGIEGVDLRNPREAAVHKLLKGLYDPRFKNEICKLICPEIGDLLREEQENIGVPPRINVTLNYLLKYPDIVGNFISTIVGAAGWALSYPSEHDRRSSSTMDALAVVLGKNLEIFRQEENGQIIPVHSYVTQPNAPLVELIHMDYRNTSRKANHFNLLEKIPTKECAQNKPQFTNKLNSNKKNNVQEARHSDGAPKSSGYKEKRNDDFSQDENRSKLFFSSGLSSDSINIFPFIEKKSSIGNNKDFVESITNSLPLENRERSILQSQLENIVNTQNRMNIQNQPIKLLNKDFSATIPSSKLYTGLSLDGGGMRGLITAIMLNELEQEVQENYKRDLCMRQLFDYIGGTSVGGILSLGLTAPQKEDRRRPLYTTQNMVDLIKNNGSQIFQTSWESWIPGYNILKPQFQPYGIEDLLNGHFGDLRLSDALTPIVITAVNHSKNPLEGFLFDSRRARWEPAEHDFLMKDVGRATSAAQTYFPEANIFNLYKTNFYRFSDGGLWLNNPANVVNNKIIQKYPDATSKNVMIVSLGTGEAKSDYSIPNGGGIYHWLKPLLYGQMHLSTFGVDLAMRDTLGRNYIRLQPRIEDEFGNLEYADLANYSPALLEQYELIASKEVKRSMKDENDFLRTLIINYDQRQPGEY